MRGVCPITYKDAYVKYRDTPADAGNNKNLHVDIQVLHSCMRI